MRPIPGSPPSPVRQLPRIEDRLSFLYLERCIVDRDSNAITAKDERGTIHIPAAAIGTLMFGPGCSVSQQAMVLLADSGGTAVWVGEQGVRFYACGRSLNRSSKFVERQAKLVSNTRTRLAVARAMYSMRFADDQPDRLTMQQLRGREGARVRNVYREASKTYGVEWSRRQYEPGDFHDATPINQALSAAHSCLYGVVHAVIIGLGCSPALGFVHTGHELSFVYDIADLYKAEFSIPLAFAVVSELSGTPSPGGGSEISPLTDSDLSGIVRRRFRDQLKDGHLIQRCVRDIQRLLFSDDEVADAWQDADILSLWDEKRPVAAGVMYAPTHEVDF